MLQKYQIINAIAAHFGLFRYLEIATPTTGHAFSHILANRAFKRCHRLVYNCPETHDDGLPFTYRTTLCASYEIVSAIIAAAEGTPRYDLIFVDPFHTYRASHTDLIGAWTLLKPGGFMVVHDCSPNDPALTSPSFRPGHWCGVTYKAYIDFLFLDLAERVVTVDTDFGVGIIQKSLAAHQRQSRRDDLLLGWSIARDQEELDYHYFDQNRRELLNLIPATEFWSYFGMPEPSDQPDSDFASAPRQAKPSNCRFFDPPNLSVARSK